MRVLEPWRHLHLCRLKRRPTPGAGEECLCRKRLRLTVGADKIPAIVSSRRHDSPPSIRRLAVTKV